MILPYLRGIKSFLMAPVTWFLFFMNLFVMAFTLPGSLVGQKLIGDIYEDGLYLQAQGEFYSQFVTFNKELYESDLMNLVKKAIANNDIEKLQILGTMAIRDQAFIEQLDSFNFSGDQVLLAWWKNNFHKIEENQTIHPSYSLGLNGLDIGYDKWLSYQFVHSGIIHLMGNMLFLLLFGCMLEPIIGGLALLIVYLLSGMVGAGVFLFLSGATAVPLIGASGAVSGIMALFCFMFWKESVRYVYFLFIPRRGYAGYVYLPGWVTMAMWVLSDLAGYISTKSEFGGIAHTAHLGGELAGVLVGLTVFFIRSKITSSPADKSNYPPTFPVGTTFA